MSNEYNRNSKKGKKHRGSTDYAKTIYVTNNRKDDGSRNGRTFMI
jgi:hypothetical protein